MITSENSIEQLGFSDAGLYAHLNNCTNEALDGLDFGVIGIDRESLVRRYNSFESKAAGLSPQRVLGQPLFTVVAPCMNNFLVAQRFEDAQASGEPLDVTLDYVLTLRMRPVKVKLRLLAGKGPTRYVLVQRTV
jgi:photoactive yellow protein